MKITLLDKMLFRLGLIRIRKSAATVISKNGVVRGNPPEHFNMLETIFYLASSVAVDVTSRGLSDDVKFARTAMLYDKIAIFTKKEMDEMRINKQ